MKTDVHVEVRFDQQRLNQALNDGTGEFAVSFAARVAQSARDDSDVPRATGAMQDSISSDDQPTPLEDGRFTARAHTTNSFYARFQHEGTRYMTGYPFLRLALDREGSAWLAEQRGAFSRWWK